VTGSQTLSRAQATLPASPASRSRRWWCTTHFLAVDCRRRLEYDWVTQAVRIGRRSRTVKVVWTREEDMQHEYYRPYYYDRHGAGLDARGRPLRDPSDRGPRRSSRAIWPPAFKDGIASTG